MSEILLSWVPLFIKCKTDYERKKDSRQYFQLICLIVQRLHSELVTYDNILLNGCNERIL